MLMQQSACLVVNPIKVNNFPHGTFITLVPIGHWAVSICLNSNAELRVNCEYNDGERSVLSS